MFKWRSILLLVIVFSLAILVMGCGGIDKETYDYLSEMQEWQNKWDEKWPEEWEELNVLVDELEAIETPEEPIPLTFDGQTLDYWTFYDHDEYIFAHRYWLAIRAHMERMQELEEERYIAVGSDEIPSCWVALGYGECSPEYKDACWLTDQATEHLGYVEGRMVWWFVTYLSD